MLDQFTEHARRVVVLSQEEARNLHNDYVGTEHMLLALLREQQGLGARVLASLGITIGRVRGEIVSIVGPNEEAGVRVMPFTQRAKQVIVLAVEQARGLGDNYVGTEHILFALACQPEAPEALAAHILQGLGADPQTILDMTLRLR